MTRLFSICVLALAASLALAGQTARAQEDPRLVRLAVPDDLVQSGLLRHILPRFSLKTQVRVEAVAPGSGTVQAALGDEGRPVFDGLGQTWRLEVLAPDHPGTATFADWLTGEIGLRTVTSYAPDGSAPFAPPSLRKVAVAQVTYDGDADLGHRVSREKCTRCHGVDAATRGWGIGSTPSFGVLRALKDWEDRFSAFYALNPHPSFTVVTDLTEPFDPSRPPPISPIELTLEEVEAVLAYVATLQPADLGAPIAHQ